MRVSLAEQRRSGGNDLYERIGTFLADQRLSVDPVNYAFAHHVLSDPKSPVAVAVANLTDGGCRLQRSDIESLGVPVATDAKASATARAAEQAQQLVADTHAQVDDFATMMRAMQDETRGFGRDLEQSAAAMTHEHGVAGIEEIARITGTMLGRIREAEERLAQATSEAETLRSKLAEANDSARRDALTGLPNRRAFEEAFDGRDADRGPYCLALCDIDRFKRVNDDHGHAVGDRVLSAVGRTLMEECVDHLVFRYGGEEFAVLLTGVDLVNAARMLDGARAAIEGKRFRNRETDRPLGAITVSIGVTALHHDESPADALKRADSLLYTAKANGRNQVSAA